MARRIAAADPNVEKVILFGSFARGDYGARSDIDLLVILGQSSLAFRDRVFDLLPHVSSYPTDVFPYTAAEVESRLASADPFLTKAVHEGIQLYPAGLQDL